MDAYPEASTDSTVEDISQFHDGICVDARKEDGWNNATRHRIQNIPQEGTEQDQHVSIQGDLQVVPSIN